MNFFGHATVACWRSHEPGWVLGAMLPDFASMVGARVDRVDDDRVAEGVALHHATDGAFHRAPTFVSLCGGGSAELQRRGLPRGSARAAAHVGIELLLDGLLLEPVEAEPVRRAYEAALAAADEGHIGGRIRWREAHAPDRFAGLCARLRRHRAADGYASPPRVAERVCRVLSRRPALAVPSAKHDELVTWLSHLRPRLAARCAQLLGEVERGLAAYVEPHAKGRAAPGAAPEATGASGPRLTPR